MGLNMRKTQISAFVVDYLECIVGISIYSKTCVKWPLSIKPQIGFQDQLLLNAGQKYCRMLQGEHSAILSTFIKLPFVIKIFVLAIFEWPCYTGFTIPAEHLGNGTESIHISSDKQKYFSVKF